MKSVKFFVRFSSDICGGAKLFWVLQACTRHWTVANYFGKPYSCITQ